MKKLILAGILAIGIIFLPNKALAYDDTANWEAYHRADVFQWTVMNNPLHLVCGYAASMTTGLLLQKFGVNKYLATGIGVVVGGMIGTTKEVMFDRYTSRTDIKVWWAGALAGGLTLTVLQF